MILKFQLFFICFFTSIIGYSQRVYNYNSPGSNCYCEMIFEEKALNPIGVIVLDAQGTDISSYSKTNAYLNSGLFTSFNFLYINILNKGNSESLDCYEVVINTISYSHRLYKSAFFLIQPLTANTNVIIRPTTKFEYNIIHKTSPDLEQLLAALNQSTDGTKYKMPLTHDNSNQDYDLRMSNYARNFDLGIYLNPIFLSGNRLGLSKSSITTYGFSLTKNLNNSFAIKSHIGGSIKIPNPKSIQSGMQSKVMSAVQNGEDSLFIDETLSGHVMFGADISLKYHFNKTERFRPFISAGFGGYSLTSLSGNIKDTLDLTGIDLSNPSSLQGAGGLDSGTEPNIDQIKSIFYVPQFEVGFEYRLAPAAKFNFSIPFKYYIDQSLNKSNSFAWSINFGLAFTLNSKKYLPRTKNK